MYTATLAPGVTFWDAGEFIAAAHVFGIPHPPGTPLFVAAGHVWTLAFGGLVGIARAMNLLSAACTALAGAITAWLIARARGDIPSVAWGALAGALCAGLMTTAWANATETEVYAVSLLHVTLMLASAVRSSEDVERGETGWLLCTAYLIALAPAVHLSALVGAPAAIALAARGRDGQWRLDRVLLLGGIAVATAGVGRMSWALVLAGAAVTLFASRVRARSVVVPARPLATSLGAIALCALAASALLVLLLRARHDPSINQGNPSDLSTLSDVVARRQYDVAAMWPRQAPPWIQVATLAQYVDWQFGFTWGRGIITTPVRVLVTCAFVWLGLAGWQAMRRDARYIAESLAVLSVSGSIGVCAYLNLKAGASTGYGFVPVALHEARERDYFFVLGFWGWGAFAGYGALALIRARRWPAWLSLAAAIAPLAGNWAANDRSRGAEATAARDVAMALLTSAPRNALLFVAGDNDTYPLWYLQQVEGVRRDVVAVTVPLLPAAWYGAEIARRTGLHWPAGAHVEGARWPHEAEAASIAAAARGAGRPVAVSVALTSHERSLLGSAWRLSGAVYVSAGPTNRSAEVPVIDSASATPANRYFRPRIVGTAQLPDDVSGMMLGLLECPRLARLAPGPSPARDSLEVTCNLR